jgi:type VI secretion system secreted protein VgrG
MDTFSLRSGAFERVPWTVVSIVGEEAVSELFSFTLHLVAARADIEGALAEGGVEPIELALAGQAVRFRIGDLGIERHGIIASARVEAAVDLGGAPATRVRVRVVPRAWLLTQRRQSRIFQHLYVHQIVSRVLAESGVKHRWSLGNTVRKRVYCTQYDETDYDFVTRLLAEEGIFFFFAHEEDFAGGATPEYLREPSGWEAAAGAFAGVGALATGIGDLGDSAALSYLKVGGQGADVVADALRPKPKDEESDDPIVAGDGEAGPGGSGDVLVFIDQSTYYPDAHPSDGDDAPLTMTLRGAVDLEGDRSTITELMPVQRVRSRRVDLREYDFRRPMLLLEAGSEANADTPGFAAERAWSVPGEPPLDVYAHHGEYETPELDQELADLYLGQYRRDALTLDGKSHSVRLAAGLTFSLRNETPLHVTEGEYAVVRVRHESFAPGDPAGGEMEPIVDGCARAIHEALASREVLAEEAIRQIIRGELGARGRSQRAYSNRFECVPAGIAFRPPRPRRAPRNVTESATVVGPIGIPSDAFTPRDPSSPAAQLSANEIYTDRFGRVKIQFHWDRDGKLNENSSCWVRVVQTWSGAGFGFQFIPRVGMEVLVTFLAGDPDRPVVIGSLYNATHATPDPLPQRVTRSGIRTQSSPGGGGFNELSFEDQKGVERIHVHAQKDLDAIVNDTHSLRVENEQKIVVGNRQEVGVGGDQVIGVGGSRAVVVGASQSETVRANRTLTVSRNDTTLVRGDSLHAVEGVAVTTVKADQTTVVEGNRNLTVHGSAITHVGGKSPDLKANSVTFVQGSSFLTATDQVVVKAEKADGDGAQSSIRLECGDSYIEIHHDKITLSAKAIEVVGGESATVVGKDAHLKLDQEGAKLLGDPAKIETPSGAQLELDGEHATMNAPGIASLLGQMIKLKSAKEAIAKAMAVVHKALEVPNLKLVFTHLRATGDDHRIKDTRYRVIVDDLVYEEKTDAQGRLQVWVPGTAKVAHVVLWANETYPALYPDGPLVWLVHIVPDMFEPGTNQGARVRLRNLAYEPGTGLTDVDLDDRTAGALMELQLDQGLPTTGELDDETKDKLNGLWGHFEEQPTSDGTQGSTS